MHGCANIDAQLEIDPHKEVDNADRPGYQTCYITRHSHLCSL